MHRNVLPVVHLTRSNVRSAATAAKPKPSSWDVPQPAVSPDVWVPVAGSFSEQSDTWAVRKSRLGTQSLDQRSPSATPYPSADPGRRAASKPSPSLPTPNINKWSLPSSPNTSQAGPSILYPMSQRPMPFKVPSPNLTKWVVPSPPPLSPASSHQLSQNNNSPRNDTVQVSSQRWARENSSRRPRVAPTPGESQATFFAPREEPRLSNDPRLRRPDPRLQRDAAPHQILQRVAREDLAPSSRTRHSRDLPPNSRPQRDNMTHRSSLLNPFSNVRQLDNPRYQDQARFKTPRTALLTDVNEVDTIISVAPTADAEVIDNRFHDPRIGGRPGRSDFKQRGSLVSRMRHGVDDNFAIPGHSRVRAKVDSAKLKKKSVSLHEKQISLDVYIPSVVSVGTLARQLNVRLEELQRKMTLAGMQDETSYDYVLTSDYAVLLAEEYGKNPIVDDEAAFDIYPPPPHPEPSKLPSRPPVVTIMGHVDHGKTTLLDTLRSSAVAKGEAGGITQHIGAFSVPVGAGSNADGPRTITFLDTPGHAAFSAMRARGAGVTDIVVLVVAADDGVMPQTREVIELIKKDGGKVGVVVAINKVDKPGVDVDNVQKALLVENIQLEVFGGDIPSVEVSGLTGHGLPDLVETLSAMAEVQDLRAERDGPVQGYVLESKVHKGLGPVATVLVLRGCLKPGAHILSGTSYGKVRVMSDSGGASVKIAYPGMAVTVSGWKTIPSAGDEVLQGSESDVKKAVANRLRKTEVESSLVDVEAINATRRQERERRVLEAELGEDAKEVAAIDDSSKGPKELKLVVKGDVSGSVEAVVGALEGIGNNVAVAKVIASSVGDVSESDVMMAKAVGGMIIGFSVNIPRAIEALAAQNNVPLHSSSIIYRLMDEVKTRVIGLLPVVIEKRVTGEATVLQLFDIHLKAKQIKKVAGCRVTNGLIEKAKKARVVRNGEIIYDGSLDTMKYLKKDVVEIRKGSECGLSFDGFEDLRQGDLIQMYQELEKPGVL